jgi:hypothetical protein
MDCPKCQKGKIRVVVIIACGCGNHPFVCDACAQQFRVPCGGEPLPPEATLSEDPSHRENYEEAKASGIFPDIPEDYEQMVRDTIAGQPELFPTVEQYRSDMGDGADQN